VEWFAVAENTASRQKLLLIRKQEYLLLGGDRAGCNAVLAEQDYVMLHNHAKRYWGVWAEAAKRVSEYWQAEKQARYRSSSRSYANTEISGSRTEGKTITLHINLLGGSSGSNGKPCGPINLAKVTSLRGTLDRRGSICPSIRLHKRSPKERPWSCFKRCLSTQESGGESRELSKD
jgi:hypothetical protein